MQTHTPPRQATPPSPAGAARLAALLALVVAVLLAAAPPGGAAAPAGAGPDFQAIDRYVEAQRQEHRVPGVALAIVRDGEVVHLRGFGAAGPGGRPVTPQTPFLVGSLTKSVTALAVMQLVEAGRIELDAPVQRYLPWFRVADADASARITVRHLLHQTSGLPAGAGDAGIADGDAGDGALERQVRALRAVAPAGPVGAIHRYSNANYITLGMVVQTVAGQSYEAYVQERILGPVGMRRSYTSKDEARADGLASGHRYWFGVPVASDLPYPRGVLPAGYLIASVEDMARYLTLYQRGGRVGETAVLSPAGVAELVRPGAAAGGPEASYAMGWGVAQDGDVRVIGHAGETFDFRSAMSFVPERGLGMVLLMNADTALGRGRLTGIADGVYSLMLGREAPAPASNTPSVVLYTVLLGVVLVQVAGMVRSRIVLGRWTARPERRPRGRWGITRQIALPLATNLAWAALTLLLLPRLLGGSLALVTLQMPDVASVLLASGGVALAWAALRTALIVRLLWRGPRLRPGPAPAPVSRAGHGDALRPGPGRPRPGGARPHPGTPRRRPAVPALSPPHARGLGAEPPERSYPFFHLCQARRAPVTPGGWGRSPQQGPTPSSTRREEQRVYAAGATTTSAPLHRFPSAAEAARRRGPLRRLVARHPLAAYLVLAFAFAWGCIAPLLLSRRGLGVLPLDAPAAAVTAINSLASYVGLLLPAVLVTAAADGRGGVRDLLGRCLRWRAGLRWYLLALFGVPGAVVLAAIPLAGVAPLTGPTGTWALLVTLFVPGVLVPLLLINLPEEAGWTGFLQARLQARHGPVLASFLVAPAFALIHLPAYFVAGWIGEEKVPLARFPEALLSVAVTAGFAVFFRLLIMWLYNGGGGSVPVVALFHSVFNLSAGPRLTPVLVPGVDPAVLNLLTIAAVAAGAVVVAVATRGRLGWTGRPSAAGAAEPPVTPSR